jgi:hypothetical protein
MGAGYSKTPLWKKLGVHAGDRLLLLGAPTGWAIPDLPEGTRVRRRPADAGAELIVAFFSRAQTMRAAVPALGELIFPSGALWVAWPRRAGGHESDIRERDIREQALPLGLVDVKVAALDQDWSGLRLVWRVELRQTSRGTPG